MLLMIIAHDQTNQPKNEYKMILNFLWGHKQQMMPQKNIYFSESDLIVVSSVSTSAFLPF